MLEKQYYVAYEVLRNIFHIEDPMRLAFFGIDEYDPEVKKILPEIIDCRSLDDVKRKIHELFNECQLINQCLSSDDNPSKRLDTLVQRIWNEVIPTLNVQEYPPQPEKTIIRYRLGEYELRESDYRHILHWADTLGLSPKALLTILANDMTVEEGAITELVWDFDSLPIKHMDMRQLDMIALRLKGTAFSQDFMPKFPLNLKVLSIRDLGLTELDLGLLPTLTGLDCANNQLTELDLTLFPRLEMLDCSNNQLKSLDLTLSFNILELRCGFNQLTQLELTSPKNLVSLHCPHNQLTELNVDELYGLNFLYCSSNHLVKLNVSPIPPENSYTWDQETEELKNITVESCLCLIDCSDNQLAELDLTAMPDLNVLVCRSNSLTELDLSGVSTLKVLDCSNNLITALDLSPVNELVELGCENNPFTARDSHQDHQRPLVLKETYDASESLAMFLFGSEWHAHHQDQLHRPTVRERFCQIYPPPPFTPRTVFHVIGM